MVNQSSMKILIDTGATTSFIRESSLNHIRPPRYIHNQHHTFLLADGIAPFQVLGVVELTILFSNQPLIIHAHVARHLCADMILGMDYINHYNLRIDTQQQQLSIYLENQWLSINIDTDAPCRSFPVLLPQAAHLPGCQTLTTDVTIPSSCIPSLFSPLSAIHPTPPLRVSYVFLQHDRHSSVITVHNLSPFPQFIPKNFCIGTIHCTAKTTSPPPPSSSIAQPMDAAGLTSDVSALVGLGVNSPSHMSPSRSHSMEPTISPKVTQAIVSLTDKITDQQQRTDLRTLLFRYHRTFDTTRHSIARTSIGHVINTVPHSPPASRPYHQPDKNDAMYKIIQEFLDAKLIFKSSSPYAAPALLVKKKDDTYRLVVDYKRLDLIIIKDSSPLPNIEEAIRRLSEGYNFFSKFDLKSGFYQIPINKADRAKTAFITPFGLYQFNVLAMGLKNAPPTFQKVMTDTLDSCRAFALVYLDDIIIFSETFDQHLLHLTLLFDALQQKRIILNPSKCQLAVQQIEYLGHTISKSSVMPSIEKMRAILELQEPTTLLEANKFLGALSWYRKFLPNFATVAAPIHAVTNLTKKNRHKFACRSPKSLAFSQLKEMLITKPLFLHYPVDNEPLILTTDASGTGLGGVLQQEVNGILHNLYYHSQLMTPCEIRYSTIEKEALAIYKCFERMRPYLLGRDIILLTDHCPLCDIISKTIKNTRVDRIANLIQAYNIIKVIHIKGSENCLPDYLSRFPRGSTDDLSDIEYGLAHKQSCPELTQQPVSHELDRSSPLNQLKTHTINAMILRSHKRISSPSTEPTSLDHQQHDLSFDQETSPSSQQDFSCNHFDLDKFIQEQTADPEI